MKQPETLSFAEKFVGLNPKNTPKNKLTLWGVISGFFFLIGGLANLITVIDFVKQLL